VAYSIKSIFFALIRAGISNGCLSEEERIAFSEDMIPELYGVAKQHDLAHVLGYALKKEGFMPDEWKEKFEKSQFEAVYRYEQMEYALGEIREIFENNAISFVPLKGAVIREYYPEPWMRTSCDIDVLIHEEDIDKAVSLLTENGWVAKDKLKVHDVSLYSPSGVHLELHFNLHENIKCLDFTLDRVWEYSYPIESGKYEHMQSKEFLIFHLLAHMSYHFIAGGCGVRSLIDIWLIEQNVDYDKHMLQKMCTDAKIDIFSDRINELSLTWFEKGEYTDITKNLERIILTGGVYGSGCNKISFDQAAAGGKGKNIIRRIFMPYERLIFIFPSLKGKKWLTPVCWIARWFRVIFKGRLMHAIGEINENTEKSRENLKETEEFLAEIGLDSIN